MITVLNEQRESVLDDPPPAGDQLWLDRAGIARATGWDWKPEGLCHGDTCVPLPRDRRDALVRDDRLDLAAMWRYMGRPVAHDAGHSVWMLGAGADQRAQALSGGQAPDFELPDLDGNLHRLADWRGSKVFLATWASW